MKHFLCLQTTYQDVQIGIFNQTNLVDMVKTGKLRASASLIPLIDGLFKKHNLTIDDVAFIGVNQGPGPFSSLRVILATVNGIHVASKIPLVGVDGLAALVEEYKNEDFPNTIALLNAFNKEVFFGIQLKNQPLSTGYAQILKVLKNIKENTHAQDRLYFIGNGTTLYEQEILETFGNQANIPSPTPQTCSLQQVAKMSFAQWEQRKKSTHLSPLYIKKHAVER